MSQFGTGPFHNIIKCVEVKKTNIGNALYSTEDIPKDTIVWKNRKSGPAEKCYHRIKITDLNNMSETEREIAIRYGYQIDENIFITPLTEDEVILDYSNYWNHSCDPNCAILNADIWIAIKDIKKNTMLTIDYCMFDNNDHGCIDECLCNEPDCRKILTNEDCFDPKIINKYGIHFMPYLLAKQKEKELR